MRPRDLLKLAACALLPCVLWAYDLLLVLK